MASGRLSKRLLWPPPQALTFGNADNCEGNLRGEDYVATFVILFAEGSRNMIITLLCFPSAKECARETNVRDMLRKMLWRYLVSCTI